MDSDAANLLIGTKIKYLRQQNGLTQQELADRAELTKGFISQLERGQVSPSVVTLFDLIECLGLTPGEFFKDEGAGKVVYTREDFFEKTDEAGNRTQWIVPSAQSNQMEPVLVTVAPGQTLEEDTPHNGEEFGYVLSGRLLLHLADREYEVKAGEAFYYEADRDHRIENPDTAEAEFLWVATPPSF